MAVVSNSSAITTIAGPLAAVDVDLLVVPWFEDESASAVPGLDGATGGELARALESKEFQAKRYDLFLAPVVDRSWRARRIALIGGGRPAENTGDIVRKLASAAGLSSRQKRVGRL